jgi:16S rRNA (guanine527-N7)-methyltransferase
VVRDDAVAGSGAAWTRHADLRRRVLDIAREPLPTRVDGLPELPSEYGDALDDGLARLDLTLPATARIVIDAQVRLLLAWTAAINLTSIREPAAVAVAHVLDSLSAVGAMRERGIERFVDIGSGGGYPGLPLAVALPAAQALLLEPIGKKARFLETVVTATGQSETVEVATLRAEALASDRAHRGRWPAVTARAVGSLAELVELAFPLLAPDGVLIAWKRGDLVDEVASARRAIEALGGGTVASVEPDLPGLEGHRLVILTSRGRVPTAYPRDPAARKRRPW